MRKRFPLLGLAVALVLTAAACGDGGGDEASGDDGSGQAEEFDDAYTDVEAYPVIVSSELTVGENRFLLGVNDDNDAPIASPEIDVSVTFFDLSGDDPVAQDEVGFEFMWAIEGATGYYVAETEFDHAGQWGAEIRIRGDGLDERLKASFPVKEESMTPGLGRAAPESDTPTGDDVADLSEISTDPEPDPAFYELSVAEAVRSGEPFVLVFATPKFCQSAVCGPTLDIVKGVATDFPDVEFIHVEVFTNLDDPDNLEPAPAAIEWKLPSEPYVFVVVDGNVVAKYEGIVGDGELRQELNEL